MLAISFGAASGNDTHHQLSQPDNINLIRFKRWNVPYRLWSSSCNRHVGDLVVLDSSGSVIPFGGEGGGGSVEHLEVLRRSTRSYKKKYWYFSFAFWNIINVKCHILKTTDSPGVMNLATGYGEKESEFVKFTYGGWSAVHEKTLIYYMDFVVSYMCVACQKDLRSQTHQGKWQWQ